MKTATRFERLETRIDGLVLIQPKVISDEEYRRRIWQGVFPAEAPLGEDVRFDLLAAEEA